MINVTNAPASALAAADFALMVLAKIALGMQIRKVAKLRRKRSGPQQRVLVKREKCSKIR